MAEKFQFRVDSIHSMLRDLVGRIDLEYIGAVAELDEEMDG